MRQMVYEHPYFHPGRILHVHKPGFINWNVEPQFVRPGLLGLAPVIDFTRPVIDATRQLPRQVHYPLHPWVNPDVNTRPHEHVQTLDTMMPIHPPSQENFLQMAWLKGIRQDKKLSSPLKSTNHGLKKRKSRSSAAGVKRGLSKVTKKGIKNGVSQGDTKVLDALHEVAVGMVTLEETQGKVLPNKQDEQLPPKEVASDEHLACESQHSVLKQGETLAEDVEEGEIVSVSPERYLDVDTDEAIQQIEEGNDKQGSAIFCALDSVFNVEQRDLDTLLDVNCLSAQKLVVHDSGDEQSVDMENRCQPCSSYNEQLQEISRDGKLDALDLNSSKAIGNKHLFEASRKTPMTQPSYSCMPSESLDVPSAPGIVETCANTSDKASVAHMEGEMRTQPSLPSLSEMCESVKSFENGNGCLRSRDPRRRLKTVCFSDREVLQPSKGSITEKRKHEQVGLEPPAKRTCQSMPVNQSSSEVLIQEPIDMEIDILDLIAPVSNTAGTLNNIDNQGDHSSQTKPTSSEPLSVIDPLRLQSRSRDPRRALLHKSESDGGFHSAKDSMGSGGESEFKEENPGDLGKSQFYTARSGEEMTPWGNIHFEGLTDEERKAVYLERARRIDEQNHMLKSRKLCLVLDLDHTLLNSAKFSEVDEDLKVVLCDMETRGRRNANGQPTKKDLYRYPKLGMWTKLRPGVHDFLSRASELYELHVYTMGNKAYATEMTKLLDPTGTLFAGRVISRGDDSERTINNDLHPKSKDLDGVLGLESAVIIIDDSVHVWPHHKHNLLVVERYMFFPSSRRQFGLSGPSLLEIRHDERAADGMLASVLKVIEKIHNRFFSNEWLHEVDVRGILMIEKRSILAGCKIVFSRVYPQGESQPHLHPLWQTAEQFGAICTSNIDDEVTHVVAISRGTDKVKWAMRTGRFSVCPAWLEASAVLYRRASEVDFPVPP